MALTPEDLARLQASQTPAPTPAPAPIPSSPEPEPAPVLVNGKPIKNADQLYAFMQAVDPDQEGIGLDKVRPLYPKTGWDKILAVVKQLEDSGRVTKRGVANSKGGTGYELYTWKAV